MTYRLPNIGSVCINGLRTSYHPSQWGWSSHANKALRLVTVPGQPWSQWGLWSSSLFAWSLFPVSHGHSGGYGPLRSLPSLSVLSADMFWCASLLWQSSCIIISIQWCIHGYFIFPKQITTVNVLTSRGISLVEMTGNLTDSGSK